MALCPFCLDDADLESKPYINGLDAVVYKNRFYEVWAVCPCPYDEIDDEVMLIFRKVVE